MCCAAMCHACGERKLEDHTVCSAGSMRMSVMVAFERFFGKLGIQECVLRT